MSKTDGFQWTPHQRDGIESVGQSLVVSAAAGSGKTAVLAARVVELVSTGGVIKDGVNEGARGEPCELDQLLVVTFTNAAARQMRDRIGRRLNEAADSAGSSAAGKRLRLELQMLPKASIGTLSSFCSQLVRRHFHRVGVDPAFGVIDEDQARLLKRDTVRALIEDQFADDDNAAFVQMLDEQFDGNDERLKTAVLYLHSFLTSVPDPQKWREEARARLIEAAGGPLRETALGGLLTQTVSDALTDVPMLIEAAERAADAATDPKLAKLAEFTRWWAGYARSIHQMATSGRLADAAALLAEKQPAKPPVSTKLPGRDALSDPVESLRDAFKNKTVAALLKFTEAEWQTGIASTISSTNVLLDLAEAFADRYAVEKDRIRSLDFADLERHALTLLRDTHGQPTEVARDQQRRFAHVLVDESQDINELQDTLLRLLSRESSAAAMRSNLFSVGDVKQSIYRFRLAEPQMFLERLALANTAQRRRIDLSRNFRSRPPLIDAINATFSRLFVGGETEIDYADHHALQPNPSYPPPPPPPSKGFTGGPVELAILDAKSQSDDGDTDDDDAADLERIEREALFVASRLRELKDEGRQVAGENGQTETFDFKHVAVLMRAQKFNSERFASKLRAAGVPCHAEVGTGFFAALEVRDVLNLLRLLDNRRQDVPMAALLRSPLAPLPTGTNAADLLARIRVAGGRDVPFFEAVRVVAASHTDDGRLIGDVMKRLDAWREQARRLPLADLIWRLFSDTGYLAYVAGLVDGSQREANLLELHRRAGQFDAFRRDGLGAFLTFLQSLEDSGEVGQPPTVAAGENVVRVMSIHAAKGLEFPVVFIVDAGKKHNPADQSRAVLASRDMGLAIAAVDREKQVRYPSLQQTLIRRQVRNQGLAEELRVLYVAMTRAREHLICVGHGSQDQATKWPTRVDGADRLPAATVLGGASFLDWLGLCSVGNLGHFHVQLVPTATIADVARANDPESISPGIRRFEPITTPLPASDSVSSALRRLATPYANVDATQREAAAGFGQSHRESPALAPMGDRSADDFQAFEAMRQALRHLDFSQAGPAAIGEQLDAMALRHQLTAQQAASIPRDLLSWWANSDLGQQVQLAGNVWRYLPLHAPAGDGDDLDSTMRRGRIDLVWETEQPGCKPVVSMADYVTGGTAAIERVAAMRTALERVLQRPVRGYAVVLRERRIESLTR